MSKTYSGIDVMACVQGNTARSFDSFEGRSAYDTGLEHCVVYDFNTRSAAADRVNSENTSRKRRAQARKKAARARARKVRLIRTVLFAFLVMTTMFGIGGIASRAKSKAVPKAYKYYDTITVQYQENMLPKSSMQSADVPISSVSSAKTRPHPSTLSMNWIWHSTA